MAPRILLCDNVLGCLNQLFKRVSSVKKSAGRRVDDVHQNWVPHPPPPPHLLHRRAPKILSQASKASKGKLIEADGRKMFQQLIDGVSYCHNKGVSHRDVKVFSQSS
ncbi:hypothetical protein RJT34_28750 [Clitoria ternatea]|uniref:Protein kinase domain-containing protein n=1 Tax=Clitoria ternatea TaxID=43366 RepID=A0AAN9FE80_CLITE